MSTLRRHRPVEASAPEVRVACIAWDVSSDAIRTAGQPVPAVSPTVSIVWEIEGPSARCVVLAGAFRRELALGRSSWDRDEGTGLLGVGVVGANGEDLLTAVLREGEPMRVLYARTSVLARLGLAGGRYDAPQARSH